MVYQLEPLFSPLLSSNLIRRPLLGSLLRVPECVIRTLDKNLQSPLRDGQNDRRDDATHSAPARVPFFEASDRGGCGTGVEKGIRKTE
jgi:hypothetical protein